MATVPNSIENLAKISTDCVGRMNVTDRRQTDGRTTTYSEREREFKSSRSLINQLGCYSAN